MINGKLLYPIGSIYMSIQGTNPSAFFGGTWERIAKGRALVGVDENDVDFNAAEKIGGEKEHKLTVKEMPNHAGHIVGGVTTFLPQAGGGIAGTSNPETAGESQPHNNLPPYFTCYIFVRTA